MPPRVGILPVSDNPLGFPWGGRGGQKKTRSTPPSFTMARSSFLVLIVALLALFSSAIASSKTWDAAKCTKHVTKHKKKNDFFPYEKKIGKKLGPKGCSTALETAQLAVAEARLGSQYSLGTYGGKDIAKVLFSNAAAADVATDVQLAVAHAVASGNLPNGDATFKTEINCICPNYWEIPPGKKSYLKVEITAVNVASADQEAAGDVQIGAWDAVNVDAKGYCTDAAKTAVETLAKAKMTGISTGITVSISGCEATTTGSDAD